MPSSPTRRSLLRMLFAGSGLVSVLRGQSGDYFEGTRYFAWQPGRTQPREWSGYLRVSTTTETLTFFSDHMNLLEVHFQDIGSMRYEFAAQPEGIALPPKGWPRMKKKAPKHLLTIVFRELRRGGAPTPAGNSEAITIVPLTAVFELPKDKYESALQALETATGRAVVRLTSEPGAK